ncbi:MAG: glycosyltransferase family 2 protein [Lachnospiraceae bacterium]|nr:glycosyltransferase family 2 protein [Lachnospiraceae bacterium]
MKNKQLSVIIPAYNTRDTIERCIKSIPEKEYVEIIIIDDGSTDRLYQYLQEKNFLSKNVNYYRQENRGAAYARNVGLQKATGTYVMFLDSDDYLDTQALENVFRDCINNKYDIFYYSFVQVSETGQKIRGRDLSRFSGIKKADLICYTLAWNLPWGQFKIINRRLIDKRTIFDETTERCEELQFTISCLENSSKIGFSSEIVYYYVRRYESLSNSCLYNEESNKRKELINKVILKYGDLYESGVAAFIFASYIQYMKIYTEQIDSPQYMEFSKYWDDIIRPYLKKVNLRYMRKIYNIFLIISRIFGCKWLYKLFIFRKRIVLKDVRI